MKKREKIGMYVLLALLIVSNVYLYIQIAKERNVVVKAERILEEIKDVRKDIILSNEETYYSVRDLKNRMLVQVKEIQYGMWISEKFNILYSYLGVEEIELPAKSKKTILRKRR